MANVLTQKPIIIDTDITTFTGAAAVVALGGLKGIRVTKLVLAVGSGSVTSAGTVTLTAPSDNAVLYPTIPIAAGIAANTVLYTDEPTNAKGDLTWRDFAVTGVSATKTILYLWYAV